MTLTATGYEHIVVDEDGVPWIVGTNMKGVELVLDRQAYGGTPEDLHAQHPYLTLGQIYSALAYYWDHKAELDGDIERRLQRVEQLQRDSPLTPFEEHLKRERQRLRTNGR